MFKEILAQEISHKTQKTDGIQEHQIQIRHCQKKIFIKKDLGYLNRWKWDKFQSQVQRRKDIDVSVVVSIQQFHWYFLYEGHWHIVNEIQNKIFVVLIWEPSLLYSPRTGRSHCWHRSKLTAQWWCPQCLTKLTLMILKLSSIFQLHMPLTGLCGACMSSFHPITSDLVTALCLESKLKWN